MHGTGCIKIALTVSQLQSAVGFDFSQNARLCSCSLIDTTSINMVMFGFTCHIHVDVYY